LKVVERLQLNTKLLKEPLLYPYIRDDLMIPIFWSEQVGELTDQQADDFKSSVYTFQTLSVVLFWTGLCLGSIALFVTIKMSIITHNHRIRTVGYEAIQ